MPKIKESDLYKTDQPICPECGYWQQDFGVLMHPTIHDSEHDYNCESCGLGFVIKIHITVEYTTRKNDE